MDTTQKTLLVRIRDRADSASWREFYSLYAPFLYRYARRKGLSHEDAEDVRADCLNAVTKHIASFEYDRARGGFRNWLRRLAANKIIDARRKRKPALAESHELRDAVDDRNSPDADWDAEWADARLRHCTERVRRVVSELNFHTFHLLVISNRPVDEVCALLGISRNQAYKAKSLVLKRIRQQVNDLEEVVGD